ncbi:helicase associated domain-containing protein [Microbacterium sp. YY-03]|uniref:helicase associated domain-containing protein n=1 Tax=Microbacterium sp. YY-03 TaxID=3421636 RepID=UPI003D17BED3
MTSKIAHSEGQHENVRRSRWEDSFDTLSRVTDRLGRLPRTPAEAEPRLLMWVTNQRRALNQPQHRQARLEALPGWSWDPRADQWETRAEHLCDFISAHGRAPIVRTADRHERALAYWLSRQRTAHENGALSAERSKMLTCAVRMLKAPNADDLAVPVAKQLARH